jgi:hypothetical protein
MSSTVVGSEGLSMLSGAQAAVEGTPRAAEQRQQATPPSSATRRGSFFERLSPLLGRKKDGSASQRVSTPDAKILHPHKAGASAFTVASGLPAAQNTIQIWRLSLMCLRRSLSRGGVQYALCICSTKAPSFHHIFGRTPSCCNNLNGLDAPKPHASTNIWQDNKLH